MLFYPHHMDINARIAQFENMVREGADPTNDMAWFSLGGAYAQASRFADAVRAYERCTQLNPSFSKAYQLAGDAAIKAGDTAKAGTLLTEGYTVAAQRGDLMPKRAIADLLKSINIEPPKVEGAKPESAMPVGTFMDAKTGRPGTQLPRPPFRGPIGEWIHANISKETFEDWIRQGTKVINELRLDLSRDQDEATYDAHMREYLGIDDDLVEKLTGQRPAAKK